MADNDEDALPDVYLGQVLGARYRLTRRLGAGGMGVVYAAEHVDIGRRVAVKILHPQFASDAEVVRRFKNEARASGTLGHPRIVQAIDFGRTAEGAPYMVMEMLEGRDLAEEIVREGPFPIARAVAIADQIADALGAAHDAGIVHRDVKPENVFVTADQQVKILDFGISKFSEGEASHVTKKGAFLGSPNYMSPEQVSDASSADARTDVYALGAVIFKMLSGRTVFEVDSLPLLIVAITCDPPRSLTELRGDVAPELAAVVARMLHKEADERFQTMADVRAALRPFGGDTAAPLLVGAHVDASLAPGLAATLAAGSVADVDPSKWKRGEPEGFEPSRGELPTSSRRSGWIVGGVAVAALAIGGFAFAEAGSGSNSVPDPPSIADAVAEASPPVRPDAGATDAGATDAGATDAGATSESGSGASELDLVETAPGVVEVEASAANATREPGTARSSRRRRQASEPSAEPPATVPSNITDIY